MKNVFSKLAVVAIAATALMSCNNQPKQNDSKAEPATQKEAQAQAGGQQIAYVEIDSIMSQYTYWKEVTKIMKAKEANISKTLNGKQQQLQQAAANFQQNVQANKYTQAQAQQIQASIQKQAQDAEALQQRLGAEYQNEVAKYNKALADSVHNYLAQFNKDKKYAMILAKSGDNILYADKSLDITNEVSCVIVSIAASSTGAGYCTILKRTRNSRFSSFQLVPKSSKRPICAVDRTCLPMQGQTS